MEQYHLNEKCDVLVVGAGPAGLLASMFCAEEGLHVIVIDRKREIGKVVRCGEGCPSTVFEDLGIELKRSVANSVWRGEFVSPSGKKVRLESPFEGYILDRDAMEKELALMSVKKGTQIYLDFPAIKIEKDEVFSHYRKIKFRYAVDASGIECFLGRSTGMTRNLHMNEVGVCAEYRITGIDVDKNTCQFFVGGKNAPSGYAWVFPKDGKTANVGVGVIGRGRVLSLLNDFVSRKFTCGKKTFFTAGCVPSSLPVEKCALKNIILTGDAARFAVASTGAGIANAMLSGKFSAEVISKAVRGRCDISDYDKMWRREFGKRLRRGYILKERMMKGDKSIERLFLLLGATARIFNLSPKFFGKYIFKNLHY